MIFVMFLNEQEFFYYPVTTRVLEGLPLNLCIMVFQSSILDLFLTPNIQVEAPKELKNGLSQQEFHVNETIQMNG
jgi:hypothetical protein